MLEEVSLGDALREFPVGEEVVLPPVLLGLPRSRVVAEIASSSSEIRSMSAWISVPFPAPDGPVITITGRPPGRLGSAPL